MKTKMMNHEPRTLEDIVFEYRNQAYGAYALNRNCMKYLFLAFLISLAGVSTALAVPFLKIIKNPGTNRVPGTEIEVVVRKIENEPVLPPPPPPPLPDKLIAQVHYRTPVIVEDAPDDLGIDIMGDLVDKTINTPVPEDFPTVQPPSREIDEPKNDEITIPEEEASFMNGDLNEFRIWVQSKVTYPQIAIANGVFGKVIVGFCVNSKGQVVDVNIIRSVDPALDRETMRVILSSPLWKAARQGGIPVKQRFVIPVMFQLNN
jgi:periplasmic protein TonB